MKRTTSVLLGLLALGAAARASDSTGQGGPGGGQPPPSVAPGDTFAVGEGWTCVSLAQDHHGLWNLGFLTPDGPSIARGVTPNVGGTACLSAAPWRAPDGKPTRIKGGKLQQYNQGHGRWITAAETTPPPSGLMPGLPPYLFDSRGMTYKAPPKAEKPPFPPIVLLCQYAFIG